MLKSSLKTFDSKQKKRKHRKTKNYLVNREKMQTYINPFKQNNDHFRIMRKVQFCSSFKLKNNLKDCL